MLPLFVFCRESKGLVGPRTVVAGEEHLAEPDTFHIGPMRRARRFTALLHADAQDPQGSGKRRDGRWLTGKKRGVVIGDQSIKRIIQLSIVVELEKDFREDLGSWVIERRRLIQSSGVLCSINCVYDRRWSLKRLHDDPNNNRFLPDVSFTTFLIGLRTLGLNRSLMWQSGNILINNQINLSLRHS